MFTSDTSTHKYINLDDLVVREMTNDEFRRYCDFSFENFLTESAKSSGQSIVELRKRLGKAPDTRSANDLWFIVLLKNEGAGFVWIQLRPDLKVAFGYDIFLDPKFRSQGIGRETISRCAEAVRSHGIQCVKICEFEDNAIARDLYQSLGFKEIDFNVERRQYMLELSV